ncbi:Long-chain-fatty-acid--CoA ligase [Pseudonocardia sp. Ae168_Ps1]|uniref:aldehyde dehydrogenase family protein n=1 Tax=unclassified Pseudonocardia TaxID=2619320 RepID=UPI00094B0D16|nr:MULTISPECIES: aldehyde dehydrogenase family protein [unclassified Pseudonocardia]OLL74514.1 Long-chain-fatty-acid--CoA ligase [Pseudonocardia sp. Ae150A_Ps1]OLL80494.1 Long-chain-fatty-acid--CoA ligase [Pseudonocardia sp. Ae168_Ps1]OLL85379.1 Long-chain-fatty-acid--CoA ligase [Pseudonocardia sp. Ae263_Ps1]OLL94594.1 Long-chain-fatty-acid--CoA ligase [Pseudonocardia sp. Ae356_Ps1]
MLDRPRAAAQSGGSTLDRARVARRARAAAADLQRAGATTGSRVVLTGENSEELVVGLLGAAHLGCSIVRVDGRTDPATLARSTRQAAAGFLWEANGAPRDGGPEVRLGPPPDPGPGAPDTLDLSAWAERDDAVVVWSSGSTGEPKGVVRSGASVLDNTRRSAERMGYTDADVLLPLVPFTHQYGMSLVLLWWTTGAGMVIRPPHRGDRALEAVTEARVTVVDATPPTFHSLLRLIDARGAGGLERVRLWCVGGAPLGPTLAERFALRIGRPLLDGYGASETGNIALAGPDRPGGCGRPLDGVQVRIVDVDGEPVPVGEEGEVVVDTPDLMTGLLDADGGIRPVPRGPYRSGDLGRLDPDGTLRVVGRRRAVHRLGHTLYPESLAARAERQGCPVRVLPFDDERTGCDLVFAVADPSGRGPRYWRRVFAEVLAPHESPNQMVVVDEFPLTSNGKVDTSTLRRTVEVELAVGRRDTGAPPAAPEPGEAAALARPDRLALVHAAAALIRRRRPEISELLERISHHRTVQGEIDVALETLDGAAGEVGRHAPGAVGRSAVYMPSNIPLYAYVLYLLVPSLYVGHATFRPSRHIAETTSALHAVFADELDLPFELCDVSQRRFGAGPVADADLVVFTGGYENAESVRGRLRPDQLFVFYGQGANPFVVGPDADLDAAVDALVSVRMLNSGQDCFGPDVIAVDDLVAGPFLDRLVDRATALRHGGYRDDGSDYGSMFYRQAFADALDYLQRHAEHIVAGGEVDVADLHLRPTVLDLPPHPKGVAEEMFAPVFNVVRYRDAAELDRLLFSPWCADRAMGASVYGDLPDLVRRLERRHEVTVNSTLLDADDGNVAFGGRGIVAGYLARGKWRSAEPLLLSKAVAEHLTAPATAGANNG